MRFLSAKRCPMFSAARHGGPFCRSFSARFRGACDTSMASTPNTSTAPTALTAPCFAADTNRSSSMPAAICCRRSGISTETPFGLASPTGSKVTGGAATGDTSQRLSNGAGSIRTNVVSMLSEKQATRLTRFREFMAMEDEQDLTKIYEGKKWSSILGTERFISAIREGFFSGKCDDEVPHSRGLAPDCERIKRAVCEFYHIGQAQLFHSRRRCSTNRGMRRSI